MFNDSVMTFYKICVATTVHLKLKGKIVIIASKKVEQG